LPVHAYAPQPPPLYPKGAVAQVPSVGAPSARAHTSHGEAHALWQHTPSTQFPD
jgi:hypothetical protein